MARRVAAGQRPSGGSRCAANDPSVEVRGYALEALVHRWCGRSSRGSHFAKVEAVVADALRAQEPNLRFWGVYAVGQLGLANFEEQVRALIDDPAIGFADMTVGQEARDALDHLASPPTCAC
jgi:hypothetical protein